jgi:type II secretory pathway component GspD/PulD (secretin)
VVNIANATEERVAFLALNQTLILSGLSQRESLTSRSGIPGLKSIPIIKHFFSEKVTTTSDLAIIMLLTPRDPAFQDERNVRATAEFVEKRRAFLQARQGAPEDMQRFRERYPDWMQIAPNRFALRHA